MSTETTTIERMIDQDQQVHVEDTPLFTVIRNQRFIELPWNALTDGEKRAIYVNLFSPCQF